ncbi:MAG: hypothetical protein AB7E85_01900 [Pseudobdellovibrionaceae bacterium]
MMKYAARLIFSFCLVLPLIGQGANAQTLLEPKARGMSHVTITSDEAMEDEAAPAAAPIPTTKTQEQPAASPVRKTEEDKDDMADIQSRDVKDYFVPVNKLVAWRYMNDLLSRQTAPVDKALRELEADPSVVPPKALLFAAEAYTRRHQIEKAALYYYLAQLRSRFDLARFPVTSSAPYDYGAELNRMSLSIAQPINEWALADQERSAKLFDDVQALERITPYAYKPTFPIPDVNDRPKSGTWPTLHKDVAKDYFEQIDKVRAALREVK